MPRPPRSRSEHSGIFRWIGRLLLFSLAGLGLLTVVLLGGGLWIVQRHAMPQVPADRIVLTADLNRGVTEAPRHGAFGGLQRGGAYPLRDLLDALEKGAADPKVAALVVRLNGADLKIARAQELRDAVETFRKSGKPAVLFSESLAGTDDVYLASSFGEIWLQPSGDVGLTGVAMESPFLRGALDQLEIQPEFGARHEYKSAIDTFTEHGFTDTNRATLQRLLDRWSEQVVRGIASSRNVSAEHVRSLMDRGPLLADEALAEKLVDRLGYWDQVQQIYGVRDERGTDLIDLGSYVRNGKRPNDHGTKVALIYGVGTVQTEEADYSPLGGEPVMASDTVAKAIRDAADDDKVKAILLRIDSPGGSYIASDAIWRAIRQARDQGKPVVASMGHLAASGGYFVAMAADRIVADPGSVTGSIGVFAGKLVLRDFWKKFGVNWDEVHVGANALANSTNAPYSEAAWRSLNRQLDRIYADFTAKAGEARKLDAGAMDKVARGRIWSGVDAQAVGLVDDIGGFRTALGAVRQVAGLAPDAPIDIDVYPRPRSALAELLEALQDERLPMADVFAGLIRLSRATAVLEPVLGELERGRVQGELRAPLPGPQP